MPLTSSRRVDAMNDEPKADQKPPNIFPTVLGLGHDTGAKPGRVFAVFVLVPMLLVVETAGFLRHQVIRVSRFLRRNSGRH